MNRRTTMAALTGAVLAAALAASPAAYARSGAVAQKCEAIDSKGVKALFAEWNEALKDITAKKVVALYASDATLLPTVENGPYTKQDGGIQNYFLHFVELRPVATIDEAKRFIKTGCNVAYDIGLYSFQVDADHATVRDTIRARYTFIYRWDGKRWLIAHHHSSKQPVEAP